MDCNSYGKVVLTIWSDEDKYGMIDFSGRVPLKKIGSIQILDPVIRDTP
jgi:hypothetical protein